MSKNKNTPISMKQYFLKRFRGIIALFIVFFFVAVGTVFFTVYEQKFTHIKETLTLSNEQASHSFDDISSFMLVFLKFHPPFQALPFLVQFRFCPNIINLVGELINFIYKSSSHFSIHIMLKAR